MTTTRTLARTAVSGLLLMMLSAPASAVLYIYKLPDGSRLVTDRARQGPRYELQYRAGRRAPTAPQAPMRQRSKRYEHLIQNTARSHQLDPALVKAMIHVESAFNERAVSRKGASGLMQLMPATATRYGVDNIFDPEQNVRGGVRYLSDLLTLFDYNYRLALAAYNAGEAAVKRHRGVPPYQETRDYVHRVLLLKNRYASKY